MNETSCNETRTQERKKVERDNATATTKLDLVCVVIRGQSEEKKKQQSVDQNGKKSRNYAKKNLIVTKDKHCMKWSLPYLGSYPGNIEHNAAVCNNIAEKNSQKNEEKYKENNCAHKEMLNIQPMAT